MLQRVPLLVPGVRIVSGERVFAIIGAIVVGAAIGYFGTVGALVVATGWCP